MRKAAESVAVLLLMCAGFFGGSEGPAKSPTDAKGTPATDPAPGDGPARPELTAEACQANGGTVVGDIGDGATRRPDYRCPSGAKPVGNISAPAGGPIAIEGSVCCPK
jgi:hypothetical protein